MAKPATMLEWLCRHAVALGSRSIEVDYRDGRDWVFANQDHARLAIANYATRSADAKELRKNLYAAARKSVRAVFGAEVYTLKVTIKDNFGEDAFHVSIDPVPRPDPSRPPSFTAKQGQYLAFIYNYSKIHGQPPAELDLERYFKVSSASVHEMIKTLHRNGLIERVPGEARSIRLLVPPEHLPRLSN